MPASDGGDDLVGIGLPDERERLLIVLGYEAVDSGLKVDDGVEDAVLQASAGQLGEEALARFSNQVRHRLCPGSPWEQNTVTSRLMSDAACAA